MVLVIWKTGSFSSHNSFSRLTKLRFSYFSLLQDLSWKRRRTTNWYGIKPKRTVQKGQRSLKHISMMTTNSNKCKCTTTSTSTCNNSSILSSSSSSSSTVNPGGTTQLVKFQYANTTLVISRPFASKSLSSKVHRNWF